MEERVRKVDVNKLTPERADELSKQIGDKVVQIQTEALEKINKVLKVYGMKASLSVQIAKIEENE
ncbi:MAG: hypothetical protein A4S09_16385 [Proteobacteria bacterium SG_bin7]|nr:MAG: hypothetical protein A4S09_16385 [Proteobacteria bacterium SG_bin7]